MSKHRNLAEFLSDIFFRNSDNNPSGPQHRNRRSPGSSSDLPPTYEDATGANLRKAGIELLVKDGMNPIVARAYWNQTQSPLVRLPDGLMVVIMEQLDLHDILRLRHVSRDFMRLFSQSQAFRKYHLTDAQDIKKRSQLARIWATPLHSFPSQHQRAQHNSGLCHSCTKFREQRGYATDRDVLEGVPFIYCAGCNMEHRAFYFSSQQRHQSNDDERICLGREGFISLCEHISITWDTAQRLIDAKKSGPVFINCTHPHSEASPCRHIRRETSETCYNNDQPQIKLYKDEDRKLVFEISITTHLPFPRPRDAKQGSKLNATAFQRSVKELVFNRLHGASFHWLPTNIRLQDVSRCFDPNICSCLDWGESVVPKRFNAQKPSAECKFEWKLCLNPIRPWRVRLYIESDFAGKNELLRQHQDRCAGLSHNLEVRQGHGLWSRKFSECPEDKGFLVFKQTIESSANSPGDYRWNWFINKKFSKLRQDGEMIHTTWCPEPTCRLGAIDAIRGLLSDGEGKVVHHRASKSNSYFVDTEK